MNINPGLTLSVPLFFRNEDIDYGSLGRYIQNLAGIKNIAAIYSMAYNTRYRMLEDSEILSVNKFILQEAKDVGLTCYVGHPYTFSRASLSRYLDEIASSEPAGISMLYPERYYSIDEPIMEFLSFPQKFGLKSVIHEMKLVSGFDGALMDWPERLIKQAIAIDGVIAIKEDSKNDEITKLVLEESINNGVHCILAGGGKRRALKFVESGMTTWLNGTTMFFPQAIDKIYSAIMFNNVPQVDYYCDNIERVFFDEIANKCGWHLAHKAALQYFGFGLRDERFPHAALGKESFDELAKVFGKLRINMNTFMNMD